MAVNQSTVPASRTRARIIGLDGARGLSCLGVAVAHVTGHSSPKTAASTEIGLVGLSLIFFYVLSGFLLFLPYVRALAGERSTETMPSTKNFVLHRVARILPGYLVIFLLVNFALQAAYVDNPVHQPLGTEDGTGMITDWRQLLANLTLVQTYLPQYIQTGLNPSWSLTLEYAFYAVLPLLAMALFLMRRRTDIRPLRIAVIGASTLAAVALIGRGFIPMVNAATGVTDPTLLEWGDNWAAVFSRSLLTNADNFAAGMLAAVLVVAIENRLIGEALSRRVRLLGAVALLPVMMLCALLVATRSPYGSSALGVICALLILVIVAPLARGQDSAIARWLDVAPVLHVGKLSLSIYLWHFPVMLVLGRWGVLAGDTLLGMSYNVAVVLAATMLVSTATYYLIEQPAMNMARRYRRRWA
ncbi:acyltransferase family protein [Mycobacterium antarcticum]|uniref:acyltransferase family protein n=1 Tax=Mycolicibacterium sp. TUM20984 TaxID=3023368 RepID=UPI0024E067AF|nr:acyltransferase [Mycolicibacterium sp. TUM20984]